MEKNIHQGRKPVNFVLEIVDEITQMLCVNANIAVNQLQFIEINIKKFFLVNKNMYFVQRNVQQDSVKIA